MRSHQKALAQFVDERRLLDDDTRVNELAEECNQMLLQTIGERRRNRPILGRRSAIETREVCVEICAKLRR